MEAIVLKSTPYQESGRVISLFTKTHGILSAIAPRIGKKNVSLTNILSPLSHSHFELTRGKSDLHKINDASLISSFLPIRENLDRLTAASSILQTLSKTQLPEKPATPLFNLLILYLTRLQTSKNPKALSLSFQIKLLRYDGLFPSKKEDSPILLKEEEWTSLISLGFLRSFEELETITTSDALLQKTKELLTLSLNFL